MKLTISISMDNAAFEDNAGCEVSRILRDLATEVLDGRDLSSTGTLAKLMDYNGNTVGTAKVTR